MKDVMRLSGILSISQVRNTHIDLYCVQYSAYYILIYKLIYMFTWNIFCG